MHAHFLMNPLFIIDIVTKGLAAPHLLRDQCSVKMKPKRGCTVSVVASKVIFSQQKC